MSKTKRKTIAGADKSLAALVAAHDFTKTAPPLTGAVGSEMNAERAERARSALQVGTDYDGEDENDIETYAADLICNLRHLLDEEGIAFEAVLSRAEMHHTAEVEEAEDEAE
jgi:hypothetical protein